MAKKKKCPECPPPGAPGWMTTFADLMSLLLTFFVLLLSFAQLDIVKFQEVAGSLKDAFGVQHIIQVNPKPTAKDAFSLEFNFQVVLVHLIEQIRAILNDQIEQGMVEVLEEEEGFTVRFQSELLFEVKGAKLKPEVESLLQEVATVLAEVPNLIYVTGHTDNQPANPASPYPSNWALSIAQSSTLVEFLTGPDLEIDPYQFQVQGLGEYDPLTSNITPEGRARNRRVEMFISRVQAKPTVVSDLSGREDESPFQAAEEVDAEIEEQ